MSKFLFRFGFETPRQRRNNARHGWDDEDSDAVWIDAADAVEALAWGRTLATEYVRALYRLEGVDADVDWAMEGFAHWIETAPDALLEARALSQLPCVASGVLPDFRAWLRRSSAP